MQSEKSTKVNFARQLQLLCDRNGLKQKDIAELCGVSAPAASKWFKGGDMKVEYAAIIARRFSISIEQLAGLEPVRYEIARQESEDRLMEAAEVARSYGNETEQQLAFEAEMNAKHRDLAIERAEKAEGEVARLRKQVDKIAGIIQTMREPDS